MNKLTTYALSFAAAAALSATASAQGVDYLLSFSQPEGSVSGSGGTVLGQLLPNEIQQLSFATPCTSLSAEKWLPRTCAHTMAGDENADGNHFRPNIFGGVDAIMSHTNWVAPVPGDSQRTVFWSPMAPMGNNISATPFRPGDVARIVRQGFADGQVEHFMRQEQFNQALGLPPAYGIDIDAIAFQPNYGVFFSVDVDVAATTVCGPTLIRDGDILCIPGWALGYTSDMRVAGVAPNSAVVVYNEAQMNVFTSNAQVADRFGACLTMVGDVEALEIDMAGPVSTIVPCPGFALPVPNLIYASENGTGASLLQIAGGGTIHVTSCGLAGAPCGTGPTMGPQLGIRPAGTAVGAPSHVAGLALTRVCRHVIEPQQHVVNVPAAGLPFGSVQCDYHSPFPLNLVLIELVSPIVPASLPAAPFSPFCFPDLYGISITPWMPVGPGYGSFPLPAIPGGFSGKLLFQSVGFGSTFELSTPAVIDIL